MVRRVRSIKRSSKVGIGGESNRRRRIRRRIRLRIILGDAEAGGRVCPIVDPEATRGFEPVRRTWFAEETGEVPEADRPGRFGRLPGLQEGCQRNHPAAVGRSRTPMTSVRPDILGRIVGSRVDAGGSGDLESQFEPESKGRR